MMSTAHITTPPRHPLVDAWIDAGILVDATFHALYDGTEYARPYYSFADAFTAPDDINQYNIVEETATWTRSVEQNCRVAATKQIVMNLVNHVARRAEEAARALTAEALNSKAAPVGELYSIYLNNFIEYLTPSMKQGKIVEGCVGDAHAVRSRCGVHTDVNMLRAQAQGIIDAVAAETGRAQSLPRGLAASTTSAPTSASSGRSIHEKRGFDAARWPRAGCDGSWYQIQ